ncbi:MAG: T9SS type A sorting domain-containing protein [Bacteroidales bacterium]|nr:T9SS type A sorting domain-containing protein [Bacteroidales bacterium]
MKNSFFRKIIHSITIVLLSVFVSLFASTNVSAQTPEIEFTELDDYYVTSHEITCTARVYSYGLIDQLCSIFYTLYKDDFNTPITSVGDYGTIEYTVRSQGSDYVTQTITEGIGYLSVKPLWTTYTAFTLGIFDNYCVNRNRPVALSITFDTPGEYKFTSEIQSCSNSGSNLFSSYPANGATGCDTETHRDYAASSCSNPTTLFSEAIFLTICDQNFVEFLSGVTEYCPSESINLVYTIGEYDDSVDMALLPVWINPIIDRVANTLTLSGNAPAYDSENSTINFVVRTLSTINPETCPEATVNQSIMIANAQTPVISGDNMICEGGTITLTSDIASTWSSSNIEVATIEQTELDTEVTILSLNPGTTIITCQIHDNECDVNSNPFIFDVNENYEISLIESICDGEIYLFDGQELIIAGEHALSTTSQYGCDSIINLSLQVTELSNTEFFIEDESYTWNATEYTENGDYVQTFSDENGCDSTVTLHLTIITDIASHSIVKETINIYPNPVSESLHIDIIKDSNTSYSIILTDVTGKVLIKKDYASENNILDLSPISGGVYFISILNDNKIISTSMVNKE